MPDVLIIADTIRAPELRHEVPLAVPDPFFYAEVGASGRSSSARLEAGRSPSFGADLEVPTLEDAGIDALLKRGLNSYELNRELYRRLPAARLTPRRRRAPSRSSTPTTCANGIELSSDQNASSASGGA